jgi:hypothetical protein
MEWRQKFYILDADNVVQETSSILTWVAFFAQTERRIVAKTLIGDVKVSTVFLGMDHSFGDDGPPLLFETMIFSDNTALDDHQTRCCTWGQAEQMHEEAIRLARTELMLREFSDSTSSR